MARRRLHTTTLELAVLLAMSGGPWAIFAQTANGSLAGRLTDLHSKPLSDVTVTVRNTATGAESHTTTGRNGSYRLNALGPGTYALQAESAVGRQGHVEGIVIAAGHEARVQAAIELVEPGPEMTTKRQEQPASKWMSSSSERLVPETRPDEVSAAVSAEKVRILPLAGQKIPQPMIADVTESRPDENLGNLSVASPKSQLKAAIIMRAPLGISSAAPGAAAMAVAARTARGLLSLSLVEPEVLTGSVTEIPAQTLSGAQLQALPIAGRDWKNFVLDAPPERGSETDDLERSSRGTINREVDGAAINLAFGGSGMGRMRGRGSAMIGPGASESAIREVQVGGAGLSATQGASGRATMETQHGSTRLHGQAFVLDRQNGLGAQNPFSQWIKETGPGSGTVIPTFTAEPYTPADREMTWGFGAGGAILRTKLFWFAALDQNTRNDPGVSTVKHPENFFAQPSNDQLQVLSARLGLSSANPVAEGAAAYSGMLQTLDGLLGPSERSSSQWTGFARLDWALGERHRFTIEGTNALWNAPGGGLTRATEPYGNHSFGSSGASEQWLLGRWEAFVTPNLLAVTQGSVGRHVATDGTETPSHFEQALNINDWGRLPQINVDSRDGFTIGNPSRFGPGEYPDEHLDYAEEQLNWVHGGLLLKAGFDAGRYRDETSLLRNQTGTYSYSSVENFASDALAFAAFGLTGQLNPMDQHNCDQTGKAWRDSAGTLHGLGYLPCYSYYSQMMGPSDWWLATTDWATYVTAQWEPNKRLAANLALRWDREEMPPPITRLNNPDLPLTNIMPRLGNEWGPRASLAWGTGESHWPVLRLGYGMYFGRTPNATLENALTQTGSLKGDLNFFVRPTDNLTSGGAPPFPYVLAGEPASVVKPGAVEFASTFKNGEVHQAVADVEETLPGQVRVEASAVASLGRRLPVTIDTNIDPAVNPKTITYAVLDGNNSGPIKSRQVTVPFFATWPTPERIAGRLNANYQQVTEILDGANSTYEAAMLRVTRSARSGLTLHARYTYAHAMDWNPNESAQVTGPSVFDPTDWRAEYGTSNLDVRHSASGFAMWEPKWKLPARAGRAVNGWMLSGVGSFQSGLPFSMRTAGSLAREFDASGAAIVGLAPGMNGYGGDNRVYGVGRNTYRYPAAWKADLRLGKRFDLGSMRQLELLAESFNLFNHQNVTELETVGYSIESGSTDGGLPTLNFMTGLKTGQTEFGQPLNVNATNFYRPRQLQFGMRLRF